MTSAVRNRCVSRSVFLLISGLIIVAQWGCRPAEQKSPSPTPKSVSEEKSAPQQKTPAEKPPVEETPAEKPPVEETPAEKPPVEETPAEKPPVEETPAEKPPVEETPAEKPPVEETPAEKPPVEETPAEKPPVEETPAEKPPVEETPAEKPPVEETPAEKPPVEETAAENPPVEETPAEKPPVEETPGEDSAAAETDPTYIVTVKWLPEPVVEIAEAGATKEEEMKPYTEVLRDTEVTFDMVPIRGGNFMMGSPEDEEDRKDDEGPRHEVVIEPFWMGKCEVTWDEYDLWGLDLDQQIQALKHKKDRTQPNERDKLVDAVSVPTKPYVDMTFGMGKEGYPAICMTQLAARTYCKWLSARTGRFYRLPTEAEWEYACRAGTTTAYSFGDDPDDLDDFAWYFDNSEVRGEPGYQKVGQKKPNPWGLYDMHGNASEWVLDQYFADYYKQFDGKTTARPLAPATTEYPRAARGGCWDDDPDRLRSAARIASNANWKMQDPQIPLSIWYNTETFCPGFRVVRPLRVPDEAEARLYEPDYEVMKEYKQAQAGKE